MRRKSNMNELKELFTSSENFPSNECTRKDEIEDGVTDSDVIYLTLIENDKNKDYLELKLMKPYTYDNDGELLYGWIDLYGNPIDNKYRGVNDLTGGEYISGFLKIDMDVVEQLWDVCRKVIEEDSLNDETYLNHLLQTLFKNIFCLSSADNFPEGECITEDKEDTSIMNSNHVHWCLVMDIRFRNEFVIKKLKPYTCKLDDIEDLQYAWLKEDDDFIDNFIRSVHGDTWDEYVIAFKN